MLVVKNKSNLRSGDFFGGGGIFPRQNKNRLIAGWKKSISLLWELNSIFMYILLEKFYFFDIRHGRLVTWLQTRRVVIKGGEVVRAGIDANMWVELVISFLLCSSFPLSEFQFDQESGRRSTTVWMSYL